MCEVEIRYELLKCNQRYATFRKLYYIYYIINFLKVAPRWLHLRNSYVMMHGPMNIKCKLDHLN